METEIKEAVGRLATLTHDELAEEFGSRFGIKPSFSDVFMRRRLAQAIQESAFGGLDERESDLLRRVLAKDTAAQSARRSGERPSPVRGTTYSRMYKGRLVEVKASGYGQFECDGRVYNSLTAAVEAITGTHYSGRKFFNLGGASCNRK